MSKRDHSLNGFDDDKTPVERRRKSSPPAELVVIEPPAREVTGSDHPRVKIARAWPAAITACVIGVVIGVLAYAQSWPVEVTLPALLGLAGLGWAVGGARK